MKINIKCRKEAKEIEVSENANVDELKDRLAKSFNTPKEQLTLVFAGKLLANVSDRLGDLGIVEGKTLAMVIKPAPKTEKIEQAEPKKTLTLTVKAIETPVKVNDLEISPNASVKDLKRMALKTFGKAEQEVDLFHSGKLLGDSELLKDHDFTDGNPVNMVTKAPKSKKSQEGQKNQNSAEMEAMFGFGGLAGDLSNLMSLDSGLNKKGEGKESKPGVDLSSFQQAMSSLSARPLLGGLQEAKKQMGLDQDTSSMVRAKAGTSRKTFDMSSLVEATRSGDSKRELASFKSPPESKDADKIPGDSRSLLPQLAGHQDTGERVVPLDSKTGPEVLKALKAMIKDDEDESEDKDPESMVDDRKAIHKSQRAIHSIKEGLQQLIQLESEVPGVLKGIGLPEIAKFAPLLGDNSGISHESRLGAQEDQNPAVLYATQLKQLMDMGFTDENINIQALVATKGNLEAAVELSLQLKAALKEKGHGD